MLVVKKPPANAGDAGLIPGSGRSPGKGRGKTLKYSCLENPMGRGGWWATVHGLQRVRQDWPVNKKKKKDQLWIGDKLS